MFFRIVIFLIIISTYSLFSAVPSKIYFDSSSKKYGFSDSDNRIVIQPIYDKVWSFDSTYTKAKVVLDGAIGFINQKGEFELDKLIPFKGEKSMWGYSDSEGELAIAPIFYWVSGFVDGISVVQTYFKEGRDWLPNIPNTYKWADEEHYRLIDLKGTYLGEISFSKIDLNDSKVQEKIGDIYKDGYFMLHDKKVKYLQNNQNAKKWYLKSIRGNSENPEIYFKLGQLVEGKERDDWYIEAAKRGHDKAIEYLESQYIWISDRLSKELKKINSEIAGVNSELQKNGINDVKFIHKSLVKNINPNLIGPLKRITSKFLVYNYMIPKLINVFVENKVDDILSSVPLSAIDEMFPIVKGFDILLEQNDSKTIFSIVYKKRNEDFSVYLTIFNTTDPLYDYNYIIYTNRDHNSINFSQVFDTDNLPLIQYVSNKLFPIMTNDTRLIMTKNLIYYLRRNYRKDVVRYLVEEMGADINGSEDYSTLCTISECPFRFTIDENELTETVDYMVKSGARVDRETKNQKKPIYAALVKKNIKLINYLINAGGCSNNDPIEYLNSFIENVHNLNILKIYVDRCKIDVNKKNNRNGYVPLHYVAKLKGDAEKDAVGIAEYLIKKGANVNAVNTNGRTPLHELVNRGVNDFSNITIMLASTFYENKANFNLKDDQGKTPLNIIQKYDDQNMDYYFKYLLKYIQNKTEKK